MLGQEAEAELILAIGLDLITSRIGDLATVISGSETIYLTAERYGEISLEIANLLDALTLYANLAPTDEGVYMALGDLHQLNAALKLGSTPQMAAAAYTRAESIVRSKLALLQGRQELGELSPSEIEQIETEEAGLRDKLQILSAALSRLEG